MLDDLFGMVSRTVSGAPAGGPLTTRERATLERHLAPGDAVDAHIRGRSDDESLLWVVASAGVLLVEREWMARDEVRWFGYGEIEAVEAVSLGDRARVTLTIGRRVFCADAVDPGLAEHFGDVVFDRVHAARGAVDAAARRAARASGATPGA